MAAAVRSHNDWSRNTRGNSKCDWCSKKNTSVILRCEICFIKICQVCLAKGYLEDDARHNVSRTLVNDVDWNKKNKTPRQFSFELDADTHSEASPSEAPPRAPSPQQLPSLEEHMRAEGLEPLEPRYIDHLSHMALAPYGGGHLPYEYRDYYRGSAPGGFGPGPGAEQGHLGRGMPLPYGGRGMPTYGGFHPHDPRARQFMPPRPMGGPPGWNGPLPPPAQPYRMAYGHYGRGIQQQQPRYGGEQLRRTQFDPEIYRPHSPVGLLEPLGEAAAAGRKRSRLESPRSARESGSGDSEDRPLSVRRKIDNDTVDVEMSENTQSVENRARGAADIQPPEGHVGKIQAQPSKSLLATASPQQQSPAMEARMRTASSSEQEQSEKSSEMGAEKARKRLPTERPSNERLDRQVKILAQVRKQTVMDLARGKSSENIPAPAEVDKDVREAAWILYKMSRASHGPSKADRERAGAPSPTTGPPSRAVSRGPTAPALSPVALPAATALLPGLPRPRGPAQHAQPVLDNASNKPTMGAGAQAMMAARYGARTTTTTNTNTNTITTTTAAAAASTTNSTITSTQRQVLTRLGVDVRLLDERDARGDLTARARALRGVAGTVERMYMAFSSSSGEGGGGGAWPLARDGRAAGGGEEGENALRRGLSLALSEAIGKFLREALEE